MIDGSYKSFCKFHPKKKEAKFFDCKSTLSDRFEKAQKTKQRILDLSLGKIRKIHTLNECCILQCKNNNDFLQYFKFLDLENADLCYEHLKENREKFDMTFFKAINPQTAILTPLISPVSLCFVERSQNCHIQKFDIDQAYLSVLCSKSLQFPSGQPKTLVGICAKNFFKDNVIQGKQCFSICKAIVIPSKIGALKILPYFPMKFMYKNEETSALTYCKLCCKAQSSAFCTHTDEQRSFVVECISTDLIYAIEKLKYKYEILSLIYFDDNVQLTDLSKLSTKLYNYRKQSKCKAESYQIKQMILRGLGRFALSSNKFGHKLKQFSTKFELQSAISSKQIDYFDIINDQCMAKLKLFSSDFKYEDLLKKSVMTNVCSLVFALISNMIRRNIHEISIKFMEMKNVTLLRIDVDSILLRSPKNDCYKISCILKSFPYINFKLEFNDIKQYISLKKRCYAIETNNGPVLKCPGLSLSLKNRRALDISQIIKVNIDKVSLMVYRIQLISLF